MTTFGEKPWVFHATGNLEGEVRSPEKAQWAGIHLRIQRRGP